MSSTNPTYQGTATLHSMDVADCNENLKLLGLLTCTTPEAPLEIQKLFSDNHSLFVHPSSPSGSSYQAVTEEEAASQTDGAKGGRNGRKSTGLWDWIKSFAPPDQPVGEWEEYEVWHEPGNDASLRGTSVGSRILVRSMGGTDHCTVKFFECGTSATS